MKKTSIGGQALIEGIMMRGPSKIAIAVRKPDGEIELKVESTSPLSKKCKILQMPFIRGIMALIESMYIGISALMFSSSFWEEDNLEEKKEKSNLEFIGIIGASFLLAILFFMLIPNFITSLFSRYIASPLLLNLVEGMLRISFFLIYIYYVSKLEDIRRVFEYHGAEHKSIHCYESGQNLTVENVIRHPIVHKRCGTSFLFMIMVTSILVLSFFGWPNLIMRLVSRIIALPIVAGVTYEINKIIGKNDNIICRIVSYPGLMIQKYATVKQPSVDQIEVALTALKAVLPREGENDNW